MWLSVRWLEVDVTNEEKCNLARGLASYEINPDDVSWGEMTPEDIREVTALTMYEVQNRGEYRAKRAKSQRRALNLLRSFLTPAQKKRLRDRSSFEVTGSAGGVYRLTPVTGTIYGLERHGKYWYGINRFCYHDTDRQVPPADVTIGQMMLLLSDEPAFLAEAHVTNCRSECLWNGAWLRRLHQARMARKGLAA